MRAGQAVAKNIDEYIAAFPHDVRKILKSIRATIRKAAPEAQEKISYCMPAFALQGTLVYFAAFRNHIGFYPTSSAIRKFKRELAAYDGARGTVRFAFDQPIPLGLIRRIVKFRTRENLRKAASKRK